MQDRSTIYESLFLSLANQTFKFRAMRRFNPFRTDIFFSINKTEHSKKWFFFTVLFCSMMMSCVQKEETIVIESPDERVRVNVSTSASNDLIYWVHFNNRMAVDTSSLGITIDGKKLGKGVEITEASYQEINETYNTRGGHTKAVNHYRKSNIPVTHENSGIHYGLQLRVYNDGVAIRYNISTQDSSRIQGEATSWHLRDVGSVWLQDSYGEYTSRYADEGFDTWGHDDPGVHQRIYQAMYFESTLDSLLAGSRIGPPLLVKFEKEGGYGLITEGNLVDFTGMMLQVTDEKAFSVKFIEEWVHKGEITTPWRLLLLSPDLNGLVNSDLVKNVCPPPKKPAKDASWIQPGRSVWSWYSVNTGSAEQQYRYIDMAEKLNFQYNLIDAGWEENFGANHWQVLKEMVDYARKKGIKIWVWQHSKFIRDEGKRREYFQNLKDAGVAGVKVDFFPPETEETVDFYESILEDTWQYELMVDFHGCNKPTGRSRTWPHEMTREAVRANEWHTIDWGGGRSLTPAHNTILPFSRFVQGHGDFTPVVFDPEELRGFTWAHQLAQAICYISPVTFYADQPKFYLSNPAVDLIRALPAVWDETRVLPGSDPGEVAAIARRTGNVWFVGVMNNIEKRDFQVDMGFLDDGQYRATLFADHPGKDAAYRQSEKTVTRESQWEITLQSAGGFVARISPN